MNEKKWNSTLETTVEHFPLLILNTFNQEVCLYCKTWTSKSFNGILMEFWWSRLQFGKKLYLYRDNLFDQLKTCKFLETPSKPRWVQGECWYVKLQSSHNFGRNAFKPTLAQGYIYEVLTCESSNKAIILKEVLSNQHWHKATSMDCWHVKLVIKP